MWDIVSVSWLRIVPWVSLDWEEVYYLVGLIHSLHDNTHLIIWPLSLSPRPLSYCLSLLCLLQADSFSILYPQLCVGMSLIVDEACLSFIKQSVLQIITGQSRRTVSEQSGHPERLWLIKCIILLGIVNIEETARETQSCWAEAVSVGFPADSVNSPAVTEKCLTDISSSFPVCS